MTAYDNFLAHGKSVVGDGVGNIWIVDQATGTKTLFPWVGLDPSFAWGGAAIIFVDTSRKFAGCANLDGSGLYNLGVQALGNALLYKPQLAWDNSIYAVSVLDVDNHAFDYYVFGGGGYGLRRLITNCSTPGDLRSDGDSYIGSAYKTGAGWRCLTIDVNNLNYNFTWLPYTPPSADYPDSIMPSFCNRAGAVGDQYGFYSCLITRMAGLDTLNPATYGPSAIATGNTAWASVSVRAYAEPGGGSLLLNSRIIGDDNSGLAYDFVVPAGCGVWSLNAFLTGGAGVYGNPFGGTYQFRSTLGRSMKEA